MSKCWKCNKEFYSENLSRTLCDECLAKIPQTTTTSDFVNLLNREIDGLIIEYEKPFRDKIADLEAKLAEKEKKIEELKQKVENAEHERHEDKGE